MSSKLITAAVTVGVAGALTAGSCLAAEGASAVGGRATTTYTIATSGKVIGPSHAQPGYAAIHIAGPAGRLFQIVKARRSDVSKYRLVVDAAAINKGNVKPFENDFVAVGGATAGSNLWLSLKPGKYFAVDVDAPKQTKALIQRTDVSGSRVNSARPAVNGVITTVGDMRFSGRPGHIAASGNLQFRNRSEANLNNTHFIDMARLKNGKTIKDVRKLFMGKESQKQVIDTGKNKSLSTGILAHGKTQVSTYKLVPGKYLVACFWSDRTTGQPHAFMGMYRVINVG